jgi:hypothetical protein
MPAVTVFMLAACAPKTPPPPPVDPFKEQLSVLQKQLLELQNNQNDTRKIVDEQAAAVQTLSTKVKTLEEQRSAPPPVPSINSKPTATAHIAPEIKPVKKTARKKMKPAVKSPQ